MSSSPLQVHLTFSFFQLMAPVWTVACFLVPFNLFLPLTLSLSLFYFTYTMHAHDHKLFADVLNGAVPHCSASTLIGLSIRVKLIRSLPVPQLLKDIKNFETILFLQGSAYVCARCVCVCVCVCVCACVCLCLCLCLWVSRCVVQSVRRGIK